MQRVAASLRLCRHALAVHPTARTATTRAATRTETTPVGVLCVLAARLEARAASAVEAVLQPRGDAHASAATSGWGWLEGLLLGPQPHMAEPQLAWDGGAYPGPWGAVGGEEAGAVRGVEDGLMLMAAPKRRVTRSRRRLKMTHKWLKSNTTHITTCPICDKIQLRHHTNTCDVCVEAWRQLTDSGAKPLVSK